MGLEDIVQINPIVQRIGQIEDPFKPSDVTTKYAITVLDLVRIHKGQETLDEMVDAIITNHLPSVANKNEFLKYVNNEHHWVNGFLYILFFEYGKEVLQIDDFYRFVGRTMVNPMFLQIAAGESLGIGFIYSMAAKLNPNFNDAIDLEYDSAKSRNGHAVIYRATKDAYKKRYMEVFGEDLFPLVMMNDDLLTQGALEGVPRAVSSDNDFAKVIEEPKCENRGDDHCEYHVEWDPRPYMDISEVSIRHPGSIVKATYNIIRGIGSAMETKIINISPKVRGMTDKIISMGVIIQQDAEEIQREYEARLDAERAAGQLLAEVDRSTFQGMMTEHVQNTLYSPLVLSQLIRRHGSDLNAALDYIRRSQELYDRLRPAVSDMTTLATNSESDIGGFSSIDAIAGRYSITSDEQMNLAQSVEDAIRFSSRYSNRFGITVESQIEDVATPERYGREFFFAYINILSARIDAILERAEAERDAPRKILIRTHEIDSEVYVDYSDTGKPYSDEQMRLFGKENLLATIENGDLDIRIRSSANTAKKYGGKLLALPSGDLDYTTKMSFKLPKGAI